MTTDEERETTAAIPDFWHAVEMFSPQPVPALAPDHPSAPVVALHPDEPAPWASDHPLRDRPLARGRSWRYRVFGGLLPLGSVGRLVHERLGPELRAGEAGGPGGPGGPGSAGGADAFDETAFDGASTALFVLDVDADGQPLPDSLVLSSCAWATGRCLRRGSFGPEALDDFEAAAHRFRTAFREWLIRRERHAQGRDVEADGFNAGRALSGDDLLDAVRLAVTTLGLGPRVAEPVCRVRVVQAIDRAEPASGSGDPLNSFFLEDLRRVAAAVRDDDVGDGLKAYLGVTDDAVASERVDLREPEGRRLAADMLEPAGFPTGRWPVRGGHPLVASQQFAVNAIARELGPRRGGLFAVNGPPGTGKTTLLRDLVAMVVVRRARALAALASPRDGFGEPVEHRRGKYRRRLHPLVPALRGHEIVVASSNNAAVENVSLEMPSLGAIDPRWRAAGHRYDALAARVTGRPAWGLVAARLGSADNRRAFVSRFWFGEPGAGPDEGFADGFRRHLSRVSISTADVTDRWRVAVDTFEAAQAAEAAIRAGREAIVALRGERSDVAGDWQRRVRRRQDAIEASRSMEARVGETDAALTHAVAAHETALARRRTHREFAPRASEILFTLGRASRRWRDIDRELASAIDRGEREVHTLRGRRDALDVERADARATLESCTAAVRRCLHDHARLGEAIRRRCADAGIAVPPEPVRAVDPGRAPGVDPTSVPASDDAPRDDAAAQRDAPWSDPSWDEARAALFLAALDLHHAFVEASAIEMRDNLDVAMDLLGGARPDDARDDASTDIAGSAWSSLFLVVPVLSSTFASFGRTFGALGREALGWLLVDEAGQAVPQAAAGAIWRARRTVVVGDPLQLEPVVTVPAGLQDALRRGFGIDRRWLPGAGSVQALADRASRHGTWLDAGEESVWVGAPLRVHRRCDAAPFALANAIAYDGLMVFGTPEREPIELPPSAWIDIAPGEARGHWIPAEGRAVTALLDRLAQAGIDDDRVFLISPFRDVVEGLRRIARGREGLRAGTVHTVQGREADVVVLVLGGDPRRPGAKAWAAGSPNLLNVAATRARRRLYVVGDREAWGRQRHFATAVRMLGRLELDADTRGDRVVDGPRCGDVAGR